MLTNRLQGAFGQTDLRLRDGIETGLGQGGSDVHAGDRAEQTAVDTGLFEHGQRVAVELFANGLCSGEFLSLNLLEHGATRFEFLQCGIGGAAGDLLRDQVVAVIAVDRKSTRLNSSDVK